MVERPGLDLVATIEALLYAAEAPLSAARMLEVIFRIYASEADIDEGWVHSACMRLRERYVSSKSCLQVIEVAGGYRLGTLPAYDSAIRLLRQVERPTQLSVPVLETLAVVAYRQPVTVAEIGAVRGKDPSSSVRRLRELGLLRIAGRKRTVGRPFTYGTTRRFLELFGLRELDELPAPAEFQELLETP